MPESESDNSQPYHLDYAQLQWSNDDVPRSSDYDDIYFSPTQGLQEARYVFLKHNQLPQRWQQCNATTQPLFSIAETGFGTGLNFLATWQLWQQHAPANGQLHFVSAEKHPLQRPDLERALRKWPALAHLADQLIAAWPTLLPGHHLVKFTHDKVTLHLLLGDARQCFEQLSLSPHPALARYGHKFDAWFLDGFAPGKNPQLWCDDLLAIIARLSKPGTTVATFTAAGHVRRALIRGGFDMTKVPGFGHKREMLCGTFRAVSAHPPDATTSQTTPGQTIKAPWYIPPARSYTHKRAAIIGAGLAGTSCAFALAQRGWQVTVIERQRHIASQASGNAQGMLYTRLSHKPGILSAFALSSYLFALRFYRQLATAQALRPDQYNFCGLLQLVTQRKELENVKALQHVLSMHPELVQYLDASQATAISGVNIEHPACYFPAAGWISPPGLCQFFTHHPQIKTRLHTEVITLRQPQAGTGTQSLHRDTGVQQHSATCNGTDPQWQLLDFDGHCITQADVVIIANSTDAIHFTQSAHLPLKPIRGQVTHIPSQGPLAALNTIICHDGYITTARNGKNTLGATFDPGDCSTTVSTHDHQRNLAKLYQNVPALLPDGINAVDNNSLTGRAGIRCSTPDYLPLVGQLPDYQAFLHDYARLRKNANYTTTTPGHYHPGLFINTGHGARGLTSTALCSELLAALINNEPLPLPLPLVNALNPARFIIRDLIRNKI